MLNVESMSPTDLIQAHADVVRRVARSDEPAAADTRELDQIEVELQRRIAW